jgi:dipeptidyl-peptidase-4
MLFPTPRPVRSWFILLLLWLPLAPAFSQTKQLTVDDAFLNRDLQPQNLKQLSWIPGRKTSLATLRPGF